MRGVFSDEFEDQVGLGGETDKEKTMVEECDATWMNKEHKLVTKEK